MAQSILNHINETIREQEGRERLRVISNDLWIGQGYVFLIFSCAKSSSIYFLHRRLDLTAPTRNMGTRKLLKEGVLTKSKSGRKLCAFLCSDILVLTDANAKSLYRMVSASSSLSIEVLTYGHTCSQYHCQSFRLLNCLVIEVRLSAVQF